MMSFEKIKLGILIDEGLITLGRGNVISKKDIEACPGNYPVYSSSSQNNGEIGRYGTYMFDDERITWSIDGGGKLFYRNNEKYSVTNVCGWLKINNNDRLNTKFVYYCLYSQWTKLNFNYSHKAHPSIIRNEYYIPDIPISLQNAIVNKLDTISSLINKVDEEIKLRKMQYEFCLDCFFSANLNESEEREVYGVLDLKSLSDLGCLTRGKRFVRDDVVESGVPCIHYGDMYTYYGMVETKTKTFLTEEKSKNLRFASKGDVVIVGAGENDWDIGVGLAWLGDEDAAVHDACYILKHKQNPKYISYFLRSNNYHLQIRGSVASGKICSISAKDLGKAKMLIPKDIKEQNAVVEKLDAFTNLISKLEEERDLREKQYEYYREKLLTFE